MKLKRVVYTQTKKQQLFKNQFVSKNKDLFRKYIAFPLNRLSANMPIN